MATLEQRLSSLEQKVSKQVSDICIRIIIGNGEQITDEQQAQMDEVERLGG